MRPDPETLDPEDYLRERYLRGAGSASPALRAYYALKPLIPRRAQLAMRRAYARRQAARPFPSWPVEPLLVEHQHSQFRRRLRESGAERIPFVSFWPEGRRFAAVLTHDVEGPAGIALIPRVREIERRHGLRSAWYFVAEAYAIDPAVFERLRAEGCEVGLHGIHHDGKLFASRERFEAELPKIHRYLAEWDAVGFRSPATHRNADWMHELGCLYDSSFSDTAPFEPQAGGCCSIFPYLLDGLVELPMTLEMDHTLWEIMRDVDAAHWIRKADWVAANHGLVNLLVHPDYLTDTRREACYDVFLMHLAAMEGAWHALPREVAAWWKAREGLADARPEELPAEVEAGGERYRPASAFARRGEGDAIALEL